MEWSSSCSCFIPSGIVKISSFWSPSCLYGNHSCLSWRLSIWRRSKKDEKHGWCQSGQLQVISNQQDVMLCSCRVRGRLRLCARELIEFLIYIYNGVVILESEYEVLTVQFKRWSRLPEPLLGDSIHCLLLSLTLALLVLLFYPSPRFNGIVKISSFRFLLNRWDQ